MRSIFSATIAASLLIVPASAEADPYCEAFSYNGNIMLGVAEEYYAFPRFADSSIALRFRYRDLAPTSSFHAGYDAHELEGADWTVDNSNYVALLTVHRRRLQWPKSVADFLQSDPTSRVVASLWNDWTKIEQCSDCNEFFYVSEQWQKRGVDNVICLEDKNLDSLRQGCTARDNISGLHVEYQFPSAKKELFSSFRERVTLFLEKLIAEGKQRCGVDN